METARPGLGHRLRALRRITVLPGPQPRGRSSPSYSWRAAAASPSRTARSTRGAAARGGPAGDAPRTPRPASAPPAGTDTTRKPGPGLAGPPPPRRAAPLTWAVRLVRARCTFCWNWRCSRGSSARSGAALTAAADAGASAAVATSAAMLPPRGPRKCVTALAPGPRGQTPSPSNGAGGPSRGPTGPGPTAPGRRPETRTRRGDELPPLEPPLARPEAISTLWAPSQPPLRLFLAARAAQAVRRAARSGAVRLYVRQPCAGGAEGPVGGKWWHHVGERDVRGAAGSARPGPGHPRGAGAGGTGADTGGDGAVPRLTARCARRRSGRRCRRWSRRRGRS